MDVVGGLDFAPQVVRGVSPISSGKKSSPPVLRRQHPTTPKTQTEGVKLDLPKGKDTKKIRKKSPKVGRRRHRSSDGIAKCTGGWVDINQELGS